MVYQRGNRWERHRRSAASRIVHWCKGKYDYEDVGRDIWELEQRYPNLLEVKILGQSLDGRNIYGVCLGNSHASHCVLVDSTLHGREWLNTQLMMVMLERYCRRWDKGRYRGKTYRELFEAVCVYVLPLMNPDGMEISQYGLHRVRDIRWREIVKDLSGQNASTRFWKANVRGVDLNRNYPAGFERNPVREPAEQGYGGRYPLSEPEAECLLRFVKKKEPSAVINYHEAGPLIYYTEESPLLSEVHQVTGYSLEREEGGCPGSFGDWLAEQKIPHCTIETCMGKAPVAHWQLYPTLWKNYPVFAAAAWTVLKQYYD